MNEMQERINNNLRLTMIDRMLKEKYNEIQYLAIQPPKDPTIEEINKKDLEWLLSEHERADMIQGQISALQKKNNELQIKNDELQTQCKGLVSSYDALSLEYQGVLNSLTWRIGIKISSFANCFIAPFRKLLNRK